MSAYTFNNSFIDLYYELNDSEIVNDVLLIQGVAGSEQLNRGYDAASIAKYGVRSRRMPTSIVVDSDTGTALITEQLDRYTEPAARLIMMVIGDTDELIIQLLTRQISDKVTVQCTTMGLDADFIIEGITQYSDTSNIISARYDLVGLRSGE